MTSQFVRVRFYPSMERTAIIGRGMQSDGRIKLERVPVKRAPMPDTVLHRDDVALNQPFDCLILP